MNKATTHLLVVLAILGLTGPGWTQYPTGAFVNDPGPAPAPEFCPPPKAPVRTSTVPFSTLCPIGNAFFTDVVPESFMPHCYFGLGPMALRRSALNKGRVAVLESATKNPNPETGKLPPASAPTISDYQDIPNPFGWGVRGAVGVNFGCNALELSGFYIFNNSTSHTASDTPGTIDVLFGNYPAPIGFTGSGGNLWLQADVNVLEYSLTLANVELNYRYMYTRGIEFIGGLRYFDLDERLNIFTADDSQRLGPNPLTQASYLMNCRSRVFAPQLGFELEQSLVPIVSVGLMGKAAVGPNLVTVEHTLTRGDGFQGPGSTRNEVLISGVLETGIFTHLWFNDQLRLRLGYNFLWVVNIPEAQQQVNFNSTIAAGTVNNSGSIFFQGPVIEFQLAF